MHLCCCVFQFLPVSCKRNFGPLVCWRRSTARVIDPPRVTPRAGEMPRQLQSHCGAPERRPGSGTVNGAVDAPVGRSKTLKSEDKH